ncbi:MAG: C25 family peptidase propeptide domain-containing protein, partial [bacterium]
MQIVLHRLILKTYRLSCLITLLLILVPLRAKPKSESDLKILQSDPQSIIFQIDVPLVSYRNNTISGKPYLIPSVPGYVLSGEPGAPALPQKAFNFGAPPNASVGLEILEAVEKVESRRSGVQIAPAPSLKSLDSENRNQFKPEYNEDSIYHSRAWVPYQIARLHELGNVRDQRIVSVVVSPVQYNPPLGEVRVYESLRLRLTFNQLVPTQKAVRSASKGTSLNSVPAFDSFLRKSITNYQQAKSWRAIVLPTTESTSESFFDPFTEYYKIAVETDGIYQITGED